MTDTSTNDDAYWIGVTFLIGIFLAFSVYFILTDQVTTGMYTLLIIAGVTLGYGVITRY